jgi:uncharacterized membrane protein YeaQ/YmgE (transglycosylase-associated protein family)
MDQPVAFLGNSQPMGFFTLIIIGGLAGWIAGIMLGHRHWIVTNILIGIAGSYVGSELAQLLNFGLRNSLDHFFAALGGSIVVLLIWHGLHPTRPPPARG